MNIAYLSDIGNQRPVNEDKILVDEDRSLILIADGIGGHEGGEIASEIAVNAAYDMTCSNYKEFKGRVNLNHYEQILVNAFIEANDIVRNHARSFGPKNMGTTLLEAIITKNSAYIASIGDSKAFLFRNHLLKQITVDHTLAAIYLERGEEIKYIPKQYYNILSQAIGLSDDIIPDIKSLDLLYDDILMFCTDGLTDMVEINDIAQLMDENIQDPSRMAQVLVSAANKNGGKDNITVAVYRH